MEGNFPLEPMIVLAVLLWIGTIVAVLYGLRKAKLERDKKRKEAARIQRRESYIAAALEDEEAYSQQLQKESFVPRQRVYRNPTGRSK